MYKILIAFFPIFVFSQAKTISIDIMSFNLMCDWCTKPKKKFQNFDDRFNSIKSFLKRNQMDFYSLQEIRTKNQVEQITTSLGENYKALYFSWGPFTYPDATLIYDQQKFELLNVNYHWLGPREGSFSFGWDMALPRMLIIAQFNIRNTEFKLTLMSSHFDNLDANRLGALNTIKEIRQRDQKQLVIAALDSNTRFYDEEYKVIHNIFTNTFYEFSPKTYSTDLGKDLCYHHKGKKFPKCMVDHIIYSPGNLFVSTTNWVIHKDRKEDKFLSDHRPVSARLEIKRK
ncbi:hypothetical protein N9N67_04060 [Bacteriovoracaceae bacterium]|nr:hypothetical protein [Bacteriovoracaceae bacterium]